MSLIKIAYTIVDVNRIRIFNSSTIEVLLDLGTQQKINSFAEAKDIIKLNFSNHKDQEIVKLINKLKHNIDIDQYKTNDKSRLCRDVLGPVFSMISKMICDDILSHDGTFFYAFKATEQVLKEASVLYLMEVLDNEIKKEG